MPAPTTPTHHTPSPRHVSEGSLPTFTLAPAVPALDHPDFTNPDPRLRPRWTVTRAPGYDHSYLITPAAFPELHAEYVRMLTKAGLPYHELFVTDTIQPFAGTYARGGINISLHRFNRYSYEELLNVIVGHEIGHGWQRLKQEKPLALPLHFTAAKQREYEADMIGVCLRDSTQGFEQWMQHYSHGNSARYPTNQELKETFQRMPWKDCPFPSGPSLTIPPLLRALPAREK